MTVRLRTPHDGESVWIWIALPAVANEIQLGAGRVQQTEKVP